MNMPEKKSHHKQDFDSEFIRPTHQSRQGEFQKLIDIAAAKNGFSLTLKAIRVCQEYRNVAKSIFSEKVLQKAMPISYKQNILTIGVEDSAWSQKIVMHQHVIIQKINEKIGSNTVLKIRLKLRKIKNEDHLS
jgi:predicted nucleic acid-binding Zn ribbon protein